MYSTATDVLSTAQTFSRTAAARSVVFNTCKEEAEMPKNSGNKALIFPSPLAQDVALRYLCERNETQQFSSLLFGPETISRPVHPPLPLLLFWPVLENVTFFRGNRGHLNWQRCFNYSNLGCVRDVSGCHDSGRGPALSPGGFLLFYFLGLYF